MDAGDNFGIGKARQVNIGGNAVVGLTDVDNRQAGGNGDWDFGLDVVKLGLDLD